MPNKQMTFSLTEYHEKLFNALAKKRGLTKSDLLRRLIEEGVIAEDVRDRTNRARYAAGQ